MSSYVDEALYERLRAFAAGSVELGPSDFGPLRAEIERTVLYEARLLDDGRHSEWLELLTEEAIYWIPLDRLDDPATMWSLVFDDRRRIEDRVAWLGTGKVHGQTPPSRIQRSVANIEAWQIDDATCRARCTFACSEYRPHRQRQWNGTTEYLLERRPAVSEDDPGWSIAWKLVVLLDASGPQENLTVLL